MTDHYEPFTDDFDRQFIDATHPLHVSPTPVDSTSYGNDDLDSVNPTVVGRSQTNELGLWGKRIIYWWFALGAAYFGLIFLFGAH